MFKQVEPAIIYSDEVEPRLNLRNHCPLFVRGSTSYVLSSQVLPAVVNKIAMTAGVNGSCNLKLNTMIRKFTEIVALLHRFILNIPRLFLFILDIPFFCFGKKLSAKEIQTITKKLLPGDIILYADKNFPIWQLIVKAGGNSNYGHAGIFEGNESVIEATTVYPHGSSVMRTNICTFLSGYKSIRIVRPQYKSEWHCQKSLNYAVSQLGKPYDYKLNLNDNSSVYCTELVAKSMQASGISVPVTNFCGRKFYMPDNFLKAGKISVMYKINKVQSYILFPAFVLAAHFTDIFPYISFSLFCAGILALSILAGWIQYLHRLPKKLSK